MTNNDNGNTKTELIGWDGVYFTYSSSGAVYIGSSSTDLNTWKLTSALETVVTPTANGRTTLSEIVLYYGSSEPITTETLTSASTAHLIKAPHGSKSGSSSSHGSLSAGEVAGNVVSMAVMAILFFSMLLLRYRKGRTRRGVRMEYDGTSLSVEKPEDATQGTFEEDRLEEAVKSEATAEPPRYELYADTGQLTAGLSQQDNLVELDTVRDSTAGSPASTRTASQPSELLHQNRERSNEKRKKPSCETARPDHLVNGEEEQCLNDTGLLAELDVAGSSPTEQPNVCPRNPQDQAHMQIDELFDSSTPPPVLFASKPRQQ